MGPKAFHAVELTGPSLLASDQHQQYAQIASYQLLKCSIILKKRVTYLAKN